ncbi:MAG TPA: VCBS repeat-containing protein [Enhygromyxa sp.]|nr:VCBS repeat-containing protein [Enhygromyxa sp.]
MRPMLWSSMLALAIVTACDKPSSDAEQAEQAAEPSEPASKAEPSAPADAPAPQPASQPDPPSPATLASVAATAEPVEDPSATGWTHYKAKDYAAAIPYFAQASLAEPGPWKHPFNLACAAALAGDQQLARLGLSEAVSRDREATANKARRDADLATVRDQPWFEPTLRGEPAVAPVAPIAPAGAGSLSKPQLESLIARLEARHGVRPVVRASLTHASEPDKEVAWLLYTIRSIDLCQKTASKQQCTTKLRGEPEDGDFDQTSCGREYLLRAQLGAEPILAEPRELKVPCKVAKLRQFEADDVDADGETEIVVDVTGRQTALGMHETELIEAGREVAILRMDGTAQFELSVAWTIAEIAPGHERTQTFQLIDKNGDGHPDLVVETREFVGIDDLKFDDAMWLTSQGEEDDPTFGPLITQVRHYLPDQDQWQP